MIENFLVKSESKEQVIELFHRLLHNGILVYDAVQGVDFVSNRPDNKNVSTYRWNRFDYWGVVDDETNTGNYTSLSKEVCIKTMDEIREEFPHPEYRSDKSNKEKSEMQLIAKYLKDADASLTIENQLYKLFWNRQMFVIKEPKDIIPALKALIELQKHS